MKCPRCQSTITATPDAEGFLTCPGCSARLRSRTAPATIGALGAHAPRRANGDPDGGRFPDATNPNATLPPGTPLPRIPRPGSPEARAALAEDGRVMRAPRDVPREAADDRATTRTAVLLESLMAEVKVMRRMQEEILEMLRAEGAAGGEGRRPIDVADELGLPVPPVVRARHRKTVLLVDDDAETRQVTTSAMEAAEIPVRVVAEGRAALAAIAEDKPDVIVMELDIGGAVAGKDVINLIKATMEWVDIPIVLYSRAPITSQREARTVHGADDFVSKQDGTDLLLARVVTQFRRG